MRAIKLQGRIGSDHMLVIELPRDLAEGPAEVIVLVPDLAPVDAEGWVVTAEPVGDAARGQQGLAELLDTWMATSGGRSKEDIDRQIRDERAGWE